ncbi:hypothetical protein MBLNU457_g0457t1 [Dothideomycetes sp. NU457]
MVLSHKSLAGPGYIILNVIRGLNIIGFLLVIAASAVMLIKTSTKSAFFFFDAVTHVVTALVSSFLIISELSLFPNYFARNWPLLSPEHGFVMLSLLIIIIGLDTLGNLNKDSNSQTNLGLQFWRIVIAAGIMIFILGFVNLLASYVFRASRAGITARMVRAHGAVADHETTHAATAMIKTPYTPTKDPMSSSNPLGIFTAKSDTATLPSYRSYSPVSPIRKNNEETRPDSPSSRYSRSTACTKKKIFTSLSLGQLRRAKRESLAPPLPLNISAPLNRNLQFADWVGAEKVRRPDSALHPAGRGEV